jgi:hypothetical protein
MVFRSARGLGFGPGLIAESAKPMGISVEEEAGATACAAVSKGLDILLIKGVIKRR